MSWNSLDAVRRSGSPTSQIPVGTRLLGALRCAARIGTYSRASMATATAAIRTNHLAHRAGAWRISTRRGPLKYGRLGGCQPRLRARPTTASTTTTGSARQPTATATPKARRGSSYRHFLADLRQTRPYTRLPETAPVAEGIGNGDAGAAITYGFGVRREVASPARRPARRSCARLCHSRSRSRWRSGA